jgi:urease accessory protein
MSLDIDPETPAPPSPMEDLPRSVRVTTRLQLAVGGKARATIRERREEGAYRFRMPHMAEASARERQLEALIVNVAGGLAGGDSVAIEAEAHDGKALLISSATAERIYRAARGPTVMEVALSARGGATLVWLPQETVLHEGARLERRVRLTCETGSTLLFGEIAHLGRRASGEGFAAGAIRESWRLTFGGRLLFAEEMRLDSAALGARVLHPALIGEATTLATLLLAGNSAPDRLDALRAALAAHPDIEAGATARDGLVFARLIGKDGAATRRTYLAAVHALAGGDLPLPRLVAAECGGAQT